MGYVTAFHRFQTRILKKKKKVSKYYNQVFSDPDGRLVKQVLGDPVAYVIGEIFTAEELEPTINS